MAKSALGLGVRDEAAGSTKQAKDAQCSSPNQQSAGRQRYSVSIKGLADCRNDKNSPAVDYEVLDRRGRGCDMAQSFHRDRGKVGTANPGASEA